MSAHSLANAAPGSPKLRVLLAEDHALVREGIKSLLRRDPNIEVVGEVDSGEAAAALARQTEPDLVIMDVLMPGMNGIEAARQVIQENAGVKVLALSMYDNKSYISRMFEAGVAGYVLKTSAFEELSRAIETVMKGDIYLCGSITSVIVKDYVAQVRAGSTAPGLAPILSAREREVLTMISNGRSGE